MRTHTPPAKSPNNLVRSQGAKTPKAESNFKIKCAILHSRFDYVQWRNFGLKSGGPSKISDLCPYKVGVRPPTPKSGEGSEPPLPRPP